MGGESSVSSQQDFSISEDQLAKFKAYIGDKKVLICDTSQSIRSSISKAFSDLGAKSSNIMLASTFGEAAEQIRSSSPEVIVSEYNLERRYGLELVPLHRASRPLVDDRLFVLITGTSAESVVAEAAEEDVDSFILKPFTLSTIRYYLVRAVISKSTPSPYRTQLDVGRQLIAGRQYNDALVAFSKAMTLDSAPAMACYYQGQSYNLLTEVENAEKSYKNGINIKEIHYKCSIALFDLYAEKGRSKDAYELVKKLSKYFPISPQRLSKTIELAVRTQNFDDIGQYYAIFSNLDERRDDLRKCVWAALSVGAMYKLRRGESAAAIELLQNAASTASGSPTVLREIVQMLVNANLAEPAMTFLKRFPPETHNDISYHCADFALANITEKVESLIVRGRKLLKDGLKDPLIYRIMIRREAEVGHADAADTLTTEAARLWPAQTEDFRKIRAATLRTASVAGQ